MRLALPTVYRINLKEEGSAVQQMAVPAWTGEVTVEPLQQKRMHGYALTKPHDTTVIHLVTNSAQLAPEWTHVIRQGDLTFDPSTSTSLDLTGARWTRHPQAASVS